MVNFYCNGDLDMDPSYPAQTKWNVFLISYYLVLVGKGDLHISDTRYLCDKFFTYSPISRIRGKSFFNHLIHAKSLCRQAAWLFLFVEVTKQFLF